MVDGDVNIDVSHMNDSRVISKTKNFSTLFSCPKLHPKRYCLCFSSSTPGTFTISQIPMRKKRLFSISTILLDTMIQTMQFTMQNVLKNSLLNAVRSRQTIPWHPTRDSNQLLSKRTRRVQHYHYHLLLTNSDELH